MPGISHHERLYRGDAACDRLRTLRVTICGAGALGSNLAETLCRMGFQSLRVIDRDRVEQHNVGTQVYGLSDVGGWKTDVLRGHLFRLTETDIDARRTELTERTSRKCLRDSDLIIDAFDNSASRALVKDYCLQHEVPCVHAGLFAGYGEVVWNHNYRVPGDVNGDICDYALARNIVQLTVSVAAELIVRWAISGGQEDVSLTLNDFAIRPLEASTTRVGS